MNSERSNNMVPAGIAKSNAGDDADVILWADPTTHRLLVNASVGISGGDKTSDDAAPADDNIGVLAAEANASAPSFTEGNLVLLSVDLSGNLRVVLGDSNVTNAGTFAVQVDGDALTALQLIDDIIKTDDAAFTPATDKVAMVGATFDDATPDSVDEGDAGALRMSGRRELYVQLRDAAGNERGLNIDGNGDIGVTTALDGAIAGSELQVDVVGALPAGDNNIGNVDIVSLPASTNTIEVVGDVAHDAAAAGNPVLFGARATNSVEGATQVAAADASFVASDLNGVLITRPHTTLEEIISERVADTSGTSTAFSNFGAGGSGVHNYVTTIAVWNSSATDGYVDFRDGTAGSVIFTAPAPTLGGSVINFPVPLKGADNTALAYDVSGALSTVYISVVGFQAQG